MNPFDFDKYRWEDGTGFNAVYEVIDEVISKNDAHEYYVLRSTPEGVSHKTVTVEELENNFTKVKSPPCPVCDESGDVYDTELHLCENRGCPVEQYRMECVEIEGGQNE